MKKIREKSVQLIDPNGNSSSALLFSGPSDVPDNKRFPTTMMTLALSTYDVGLALVALSDMLQWKKLSLMCDTVHIRLNSILRGVTLAFTKRSADFDILTTRFISESIDNPYPEALTKSCQHSRSEFAYLI
jgi:hypothetical protein